MADAPSPTVLGSLAHGLTTTSMCSSPRTLLLQLGPAGLLTDKSADPIAALRTAESTRNGCAQVRIFLLAEGDKDVAGGRRGVSEQ